MSKIKLKPGDVLYRYLPEYQVFHVGLVISVERQHMDFIRVLEFDDSNIITLTDLRGFLWFRKYFWVATFNDELSMFGSSVFRSLDDRLKTALMLYKDNNLTYTIHRYNCEYFARRCVFNEPRLWASKQTQLITKSRAVLYAKLGSILVSNILSKFNNNLEFERDLLKDEIGFFVDKRGNVKCRKKV